MKRGRRVSKNMYIFKYGLSLLRLCHKRDVSIKLYLIKIDGGQGAVLFCATVSPTVILIYLRLSHVFG